MKITMTPLRRLYADLFAWLAQPTNLAALLLASLPLILVCLYAYTNTEAAPWRDQWDNSARLAIAIRQGDFSPAMLLHQRAGHLFLYNYLTTALLTPLTSWNIALETALNIPLALLNLILLLVLFARHIPQRLALVLPIFALLIFAPAQDVNWTTGFMGYSQHNNLWLLVLLLILTPSPLSRWHFGAALLCGLGATFASGNGLLIWPIGALVLGLQGERNTKRWGFWLGVGALAILSYQLWARVEVGAGEADYSAIDPASLNPIGNVHFALLYVGGLATLSNQSHALLWAVLGLSLLSLNLAYLWRSGKSLDALAVWIALAAYALGNGLLTSLGRLKAYDETYLGLALSSHYGSVALWFWVAIVASLVLLFEQIKTHQGAAWLLRLNMLILALAAAFFLQANLAHISRTTTFHGALIGHRADFYEAQECVRRFPLQREIACLDSVARTSDGISERVLQIAAYRLTLFADTPREPLLPQADHAAPLILMTESPWLNLYLRDHLLTNFDPTLMLHIAPDGLYPAADFPHPLSGHYQAYDPAAALHLLGFLVDHPPTFWLIYSPNTDPTLLETDLRAAGYHATPTPITVAAYQGAALEIRRYQRLPEDFNTPAFMPLFGFADGLQLLSWSLVGEARPCQTISIGSWWMATAPLSINYSASLRLIDANGQNYANIDAPPSGFLMGLWSANTPYYDERSLSLPCDLPDGRYRLGFVLYDLQSLKVVPLGIANDLAPLLSLSLP